MFYLLNYSPPPPLLLLLLSHFSRVQLCNHMGCSLSGSSVHRILQARVLEWVTMPSSRGSSQSRDQTQVSFIAGRFCTGCQRDICTYVFIGASFTIVKIWKEPKCLSMNEWIKNNTPLVCCPVAKSCSTLCDPMD